MHLSVILILVLEFGNDLGQLVLFDVAEDFAVDGHDRGQAAAADAADGFDRPFAIFGCAVDGTPDLALDSHDEVLAALEVACGSHADLDLNVAGLLEFEQVVEGYDAVDFGDWDLEPICNFKCRLARDEAEVFLYAVQDHDQVARLVFPVRDELNDVIRKDLLRRGSDVRCGSHVLVFLRLVTCAVSPGGDSAVAEPTSPKKYRSRMLVFGPICKVLIEYVVAINCLGVLLKLLACV